MNYENENWMTYFTKDSTWKTTVTIGSLLILISLVITGIAQPEEGATPNLSLMVGVLLIYSFLSCYIQGFYMKNTNSLIVNNVIKLANFADFLELFLIGLKYYAGMLLYLLIMYGISMAIFMPMFLNKSFNVFLFMIPLLILVPLFVFAVIYAGFSYSEHLTFSSIFSFRKFGKYKVGKFIGFNCLFWVVFIVIAIIINLMIKDIKVAEYGFYIVISPVMFIYSLLISKIQADSIKETMIPTKSVN